MALNTKTVKRRIKSIGSTKKITKAMEMISAVKMRRAMNSVLASRSYATLAWEMLTEIAANTPLGHHPYLSPRPIKRVGIILITSNRGLAGGFSSRLLQEVHTFITGEEAQGRVVEVMLTGRRGKRIYQKFGHTIIAEFEKMDLTTTAEEILPLARLALTDFVEGKFDKIVVAYMDFRSTIQQVPVIKQIVPIGFDDAIIATHSIATSSKIDRNWEAEMDQVAEPNFLFEPNPRQVLEILLPRLVETQIYQAFLESDAAEHSARMLAMRNASEAAGDMITELNYSFNKARQGAITQEISEIVGGAAAQE